MRWPSCVIIYFAMLLMLVPSAWAQTAGDGLDTERFNPSMDSQGLLDRRLGIAAAQAGKHVIVEKPMALTLEEADRLIHVCDQAGVKLFVVKQNRYNRPVRAARRALEAGRLGHLFLGGVRVLWHRDQSYYDSEPWRGTWVQDGGVITNQASHHIDLLLWFMGEPVSVFATGATVMHAIETEDTATVLIRFRGGAGAQASRRPRPPGRRSGWPCPTPEAGRCPPPPPAPVCGIGRGGSRG